MTRLPTPGGDSGQWGTLLNEFLATEHNADGTLKKASLITGAQQTSEKGEADGYAGLDNSGVVPLPQLPPRLAGVGDYQGVEASTQVIPDGVGIFSRVVWDNSTAALGTSVSWSLADDDTIQVNTLGVYAINVEIAWNDTDDPPVGMRWAQIGTSCGFSMHDQRGGTPDGYETIQALQFTARLLTNQDIYILLRQTSGGDLTPSIRCIVTRVA